MVPARMSFMVVQLEAGFYQGYADEFWLGRSRIASSGWLSRSGHPPPPPNSSSSVTMYQSAPAGRVAPLEGGVLKSSP